MTGLDLAKRAVACKGWRWMPGMRYVTDAWNRDGFDRVPDRPELAAFQAWVAALPDFSDPATRGCLLQLVREAWGNPHMYLSPLERSSMAVEWRAVWMVPPGELGGYKAWDGPTETAALIAALEAAP